MGKDLQIHTSALRKRLVAWADYWHKVKHGWGNRSIAGVEGEHRGRWCSQFYGECYLLNLGIAPYYTPVHQVNLNLPQTTVLHTIRLRLYLGLPMVYIAAMCMLSTNASRAAATVARAAPSEFPAMNSFRLFPSSSYSFLTVACMPLSPSHTVFRPSSKPYRHSRIWNKPRGRQWTMSEASGKSSGSM